LLTIGNNTQKNYYTSKLFTIKEFGRPHLMNSPLSALNKTPSPVRHLWTALNPPLSLSCFLTLYMLIPAPHLLKRH